MSVRVCRWGILSTASIGRKNWQAIGRAGNATVVAVASRTTASANQYIDDNQQRFAFNPRPKAYGSYADLLDDPNVDAVYVPLPTGMRKEWVIRAAEAGKHVLCEKPCAVNAEDLRAMIEACRKNKVQFMDGVMYMHTERMEALRSVVDDPNVVGDLKRIATQFSFCAPPEFFQNNIRADSALEPQGCLGDLGWYTIRFALWIMQNEMPRVIRGRILSSVPSTSGGNPIPTEFSGELIFENGVSASFYNSFLTGHQQWAVVSGTKGLVQVNDFVLPIMSNSLSFESRVCDFNPSGWDFNMECYSERYATREFSNMHETAQETKLFRKFSDLVLRGKPDAYWPDIALRTQIVMDACLHSAQNGSVDIEIDAQEFANV
ncbi:MAG: Gfo/Idh/MocA family oxidoreductase [Pirellulaceae bacterium]